MGSFAKVRGVLKKMRAICLIDTTIFLEILKVPRKSNKHKEVLIILENKIKDDELLFLPMATIIETGNHIAQNGDGRQRFECASKFVSQVKKAMEGKSPFQPIKFLSQEQLQKWLDEFPDSAKKGHSLGDLSIIHDWKMICNQNPGRKVYIWASDGHLNSYCSC